MLLSEVSGVKPSRRTFEPSPLFISPTCAVGIEIELENIPRYNRPPVSPEFWDITDDGSLRNNGVEYVSKPLFGKDIEMALDDLADAVARSNYTITDRCGLHIHIDVSGMTTENLLSNCVAYALVENGIYNYVGNNRRENIYCLPMSRTDALLPFLNSIKYGQSSNEIANSINATCKYSGFNILPVMYQGSIEYRHHVSTIDKEEIIKWINIIMRIREVSFGYSAVELTSMDYARVKELLTEEDMHYSYNDWLSGFIVAKDVLNFNKLSDEWDEVKDNWADPSRLFFSNETKRSIVSCVE